MKLQFFLKHLGHEVRKDKIICQEEKVRCTVKIIIPHQHGRITGTHKHRSLCFLPLPLLSWTPYELWMAGLTQVQMCSTEIYSRLQPCIHPHKPGVKGEVVKQFDKFYSFVAALLCQSMRTLATEKKIYWRAGTKAKTNKHQSSQQRQKQKHTIWPSGLPRWQTDQVEFKYYVKSCF